MFGLRIYARAALLAVAAAIALGHPDAAPAQTIDLSLNVFYSTPHNKNSGGTWELVAKSSGFGIAGVEAHVKNIASATNRGPRGTVNGSDPAGFSLFSDVPLSEQRWLIIGQIPLAPPLPGGDEETIFYGVGTLTNGAPDWPGKPGSTNCIGPAFTSLTSPTEIPWAVADAFGDSNWSTAARLASGSFATNVTPSFASGSSGNVFTTLGTSTTLGDSVLATISTFVRTNFAPSGDYNQNGVVDAADYVLWRKTVGQAVTAGTGADGNNNGLVDPLDYDYWRARFGNVISPGSGSSLVGSAVPEPQAATLLAILAMFATQRTTRRLKRAARGLAA